MDVAADPAIATSLRTYDLNVEYWSQVIKDVFPGASRDDIISKGKSAFQSLRMYVKHEWENEALMALLHIPTNSHDNYQRHIAASASIRLDTLHDATKQLDSFQTPQEDLIKAETLAREALNIPTHIWDKSRDRLLDHSSIVMLQSNITYLKALLQQQQVPQASAMLYNCSKGLALSGILMSNDARVCIKQCKPIIEVPTDATLTAPTLDQIDYTAEFSSPAERALFQKSLDSLGFSLAARANARDWDYPIIPPTLEKSNTFCTSVRQIVVPTAACHLKPEHLRISQQLRGFLKQLDMMLDSNTRDDRVEFMCKEILDQFGSHVQAGTVHFGGIFEWKATCDSIPISDCRDFVHSILTSYVSMSFCGNTKVGSLERGDQIMRLFGSAESCPFAEGIITRLDTKGGPKNQTSFPLWKIGLALDSRKWEVIDRGPDLCDSIMGIWEIVLNERSKFKQPEEIAGRLQHMWQQMSGIISHTSSACQKQSPDLLDKIGLERFYPSKMMLGDVMRISNKNPKNDQGPYELTLGMLQKLIMLNRTGRDQDVSKTKQAKAKRKPLKTEKHAAVVSSILGEFDDEEDEIKVNPMDAMLITFQSCDLRLRQILLQKMFMCQLAVPFIFPEVQYSSLTYCDWALRDIVIGWKDTKQQLHEETLHNPKFNTVSFLRLGESLPLSKSIMLNNILSKQVSNTFFHRDSPHGSAKRDVADGLIEASWYRPSGKDTDVLPKVTMFLNLRGDGTYHTKQVRILSILSNTCVVFADMSKLTDSAVTSTMQEMKQSKAGIVLCLTSCDPASIILDVLADSLGKFTKQFGIQHIVTSFKGKKEKNSSMMRQELISKIHESQKGPKAKLTVKNLVKNSYILTDGTGKSFKLGEHFAEICILYMQGKSPSNIKKEMLPLQRELWNDWSTKQKKLHRLDGKSETETSVDGSSKIVEQMEDLRNQQLQICTKISRFTRCFISTLAENITDQEAVYVFMQSLRFHFNTESRKILPALQENYNKKWNEFKAAKNRGPDNQSNVEKKWKAVVDAEHALSDASLGTEHLLRELGQLYEGSRKTTSRLPFNRDQLAEITASMFFHGHPLEVMDGDVSNVPLTWIKAVFTQLHVAMKEKKVFVLSVLGVQSSGKSTLLNTMFGLQLAVSAGRCTRGVYFQLVEVDNKNPEFPFDYILVVDAEGLRAPGQSRSSYDHDNELATFVIGLGDVTLINIKGENVSEVKDVLQIVVHAFLRMKMVNEKIHLQRSCIFVHQNVDAIDADQKMMAGHHMLQHHLDEMTVEAAHLERIEDIYTFNQVIGFNETNVFYFPNLWLGDPPMAPANEGYSNKALELKAFCLELAKKQKSFMTFEHLADHIKDLWIGIISEDFVFSFRNSLAVKAYSQLESEYYRLTREIESKMREWFLKDATNKLVCCHSTSELDRCCETLFHTLEKLTKTLHQNAHQQLKDYIEKQPLKNIVIQWEEENLNSLKSASQDYENSTKRDILDRKQQQNMKVISVNDFGEAIQQIVREAIASRPNRDITPAEKEQIFSESWSSLKYPLEHEAMDKEEQAIEDILKIEIQKSVTKDTSSQIIRKEMTLLKNELHTLKGSIPEADITENFIRERPKKAWEKLTNFLGLTDMKCSALKVTNSIFHDVEEYLSDLCRQDCKFHPYHVKDMLQIVSDRVQDHNEKDGNQYNFTILRNYEVKLKVNACRFAIKIFKSMNEDYERKNGKDQKMNELKLLVKIQCDTALQENIKAQEKLTADNISEYIEQLMIKAIQTRIPGLVVDKVAKVFDNRKYNLLVEILKTLASEKTFENFQLYLMNPRSYAKTWIRKYTEKGLFEKREGQTSFYAQLAKPEVTQIIKHLRTSLTATTERMLKLSTPDMKQWILTFSESMQPEMAIPHWNWELEQVKQCELKDLRYFKQLVEGHIDGMETRVNEHFEKETADTIKWVSKTPYRSILKRLWGCESSCPFCAEPCHYTDPNHIRNVPHRCIQHRPQGVSGLRYSESHKLAVDSCNFSVQKKRYTFECSACRYKCFESKECKGSKTSPDSHFLIEYKKFLPRWDIAPSPSMESSTYWMWFMATFEKELQAMYSAQAPDIPPTWRAICLRKAVESLHKL